MEDLGDERVPLASDPNMAHVRQSGPDLGLGFQVKVRKPFSAVPYSLGSDTVDQSLEPESRIWV